MEHPFCTGFFSVTPAHPHLPESIDGFEISRSVMDLRASEGFSEESETGSMKTHREPLGHFLGPGFRKSYRNFTNFISWGIFGMRNKNPASDFGKKIRKGPKWCPFLLGLGLLGLRVKRTQVHDGTSQPRKI